MEAAPCERLGWDSEFFGRRIARVTSPTLDAAQMSRVIEWCRVESIECLYLLSDSADTATANLAAQNGFNLVDIRVTLEAAVETRHPSGTVDAIRPAIPEDVPALREIARVSHRDSRFYQDPNFTDAQCDALYETWIDKSCAGYADVVLVEKVDGRATGYVSCHSSGTAPARIGLFAVAPGARGRGVGRGLVGEALRWFHEHGASRVSVVTQGRNVAAQRLYQRAGFQTVSLALWHHRWFDRR
jgi:dTDP-4-amino-4,6-dideoxy-D-galactose acyltransferase